MAAEFWRTSTFSAACNIALFAVSLVCYVLLILLFTNPQAYRRDSFIHPGAGAIQPSVAIALVTAILASATAALNTRCAEQSLWLYLSPNRVKMQTLTIKEVHHLARWTVSPLARILIYPIHGSSWRLKFGGILLFAAAIVNPVLQSGISQQTFRTPSERRIPPTVNMFTNRADQEGTSAKTHDTPTIAASIAEMSNLTASTSNICTDTNCQIRAWTNSLMAKCKYTSRPNPDQIGTIMNSKLNDSMYLEICSDTRPDLCRSVGNLPDPDRTIVFANFTTTYHPDCPLRSLLSNTVIGCVPGAFATLFGVYVNDVIFNANATKAFNIIECSLQFGNVTITQDGISPPRLDRDTFQPAPDTFTSTKYYLGWGFLAPVYALPGHVYNAAMIHSPYEFVGNATRLATTNLYDSLLFYYLLGKDATNPPDRVARQIEKNFDRATLQAFAKLANASDMTVTTTSEDRRYVYDAKVLLILLVPLFATILSSIGRLRVGDADTIVTYSPVDIARRGPVSGLPQGRLLDTEERDRLEKLHVWGVKDRVVDKEGMHCFTTGFVAGVRGAGSTAQDLPLEKRSKSYQAVLHEEDVDGDTAESSS